MAEAGVPDAVWGKKKAISIPLIVGVVIKILVP
jgi:hypothetical protein